MIVPPPLCFFSGLFLVFDYLESFVICVNFRIVFFSISVMNVITILIGECIESDL